MSKIIIQNCLIIYRELNYKSLLSSPTLSFWFFIIFLCSLTLTFEYQLWLLSSLTCRLVLRLISIISICIYIRSGCSGFASTPCTFRFLNCWRNKFLLLFFRLFSCGWLGVSCLLIFSKPSTFLFLLLFLLLAILFNFFSFSTSNIPFLLFLFLIIDF